MSIKKTTSKKIALPTTKLEDTFTINTIMEKVLKEYKLQSLYLFYKREQIEEKQYRTDWADKFDTFYTVPVISAMMKINNEIEELDMKKLKNICDTDTIMIKFKKNRDRYKLMSRTINMLQIDTEQKEFNNIKYYPSKTILYKEFDEYMKTL